VFSWAFSWDVSGGDERMEVVRPVGDAVVADRMLRLVFGESGPSWDMCGFLAGGARRARELDEKREDSGFLAVVVDGRRSSVTRRRGIDIDIVRRCVWDRFCPDPDDSGGILLKLSVRERPDAIIEASI
jgi:hypothetical protein